ncbi:hypothetical protein RND71_016126 [Anisodus tanguticus]|uniref:Serine-threonine/tyrosine-protein kinase catalytic domain-containing protein n=1 Tax=Anisodus tanguticus TaxID=243964 RepID=A0AAE1S6T7_9SOLA|nr:hypothetical protein RND71_016126 [Anisodus tanguticus]
MGDVYSDGILLMETFTRKKPMDDLFVEELTLKRWVFESFPDRVVDVVDANEQFSSKETCFKLLMELALQCTSESPQDRITMKDVLIRLNKIQTNFLQSATYKPKWKHGMAASEIVTSETGGLPEIKEVQLL